MKKLFIITSFLFIFAAGALHAETTYKSIQDEVEKKMKMIREGGGSGQVVEEIKIDKRKKYRSKKKKKITKKPENTGYIGNLSALNIVAGMFEGGIIGAGCGLIGYSRTMNTDNMHLIKGAIIGTSAGLIMGAALSGFEAATQRYSASDDFGYNLLGGMVVGSILGAGGGAISYAKTDDLENVSEGMGYGIAFGAAGGFILALVEVFLPEKYRGGGAYGGEHSLKIKNDGKNSYLSYNIEY